MRTILACIDTVDPDNFVMLLALHKLIPNSRIYPLITGRPVNLKATKSDPLWKWSMDSSLLVQHVDAYRVSVFLKQIGIENSDVYDGGIAPRTLVPHHIHFEEYYRFYDIDPIKAVQFHHQYVKPLEELIEKLDNEDEFSVVIGGPMTGLYNILQRRPDFASKIKSVHAMFGTWGSNLMEFEGEPRGQKQFNVACDPFSAKFVLDNLQCPIHLMTTDVTRVDKIGFKNANDLREFLPKTQLSDIICDQYDIWYKHALEPRKEIIYIHDLVSAISLTTFSDSIYEMIPVDVFVPLSIHEQDKWGELRMKKSDSSHIHASTALKEKGEKYYKELLTRIFS